MTLESISPIQPCESCKAGDVAYLTSSKSGVEPYHDSSGSRSQSPLMPIELGPTQILRSSAHLSWRGILLERHLYSPGERGPAPIEVHVISMWHRAPVRIEYRNLDGRFKDADIRRRTIMITPPGQVPESRLHTPAELTHCALETEFVLRVANEIGRNARDSTFRIGLDDNALQTLIRMLLDELEAECPSGRLYVDSLVHTLATRYLLLGADRRQPSKARVTGLVPRVLNRIRAKIEADLDTDLSLETLAEESGYSRAHFLRMFQASTGFTPHQYVLDLRLKRAQERLKQANSTIIDVALSCGFSSQSHMTTVFRRHFQMTPAAFRRSG